MRLSHDQKNAYEHIQSWGKSPREPLRVGGYAGTGKTTLISYSRKQIHNNNKKVRVAFACPTGMASQNLAGILRQDNVLFDKDYIGTIHRLIYTPEVDGRGQILTWMRKDEIKSDLIIVDEGSMVTRRVWQDLLSYKIPILVFGDHGQLPPVGDTFNLMEEPDVELLHIHRQAEGNPIIKLANMARRGEEIPVNKYGDGIEKIDRGSFQAQDISERFFNSRDTDSLILCGTNKLRNQLNSHIRSLMHIEEIDPTGGDKVVCLKNIYENKGGAIYNGMIGTVSHITNYDEHRYEADIYFPEADTTYSGLISKEQFDSPQVIKKLDGVAPDEVGDRFDYGYALTVHKAQGSQARKVLVFDEAPYFREDASKWLYTAITRAREELYILGN